MGRVAAYGDDAYQNAVSRINNPLEVDNPNLRNPNQWAGPNEIDASIKDARWDKGVGAEYQASAAAKAKRGQAITDIGAEYQTSIGAREPWDGGVMDEYKARAEAKSTREAPDRLKARVAKDAAAARAADSPFGARDGVIGEDVPDRSAHPKRQGEVVRGGPIHSTKSTAVSSAADATSDMDKLIKGGKNVVKGAGLLGSAVGGYQTGDAAMDLAFAETEEEKNAAFGRLGEEAGFWATVAGMTMTGAAAGSATGTPHGMAIGTGVGLVAGIGAGMGLTGEGDVMDANYAGQYWRDSAGGRMVEGGLQGAGNLMDRGTTALAGGFGQTSTGQSMANWEMPKWMKPNTMGGESIWSAMTGGGAQAAPGAGPAPTQSLADADAYAALGMPDQMTGAAAPGGAAAKKKDWDAIIARMMGEDSPSALYSDRQMETMGTDGKDQFFGSATSRRKSDTSHGPGTFIPEEKLAGEGPIDLNEYIQRMQDTRAAKQVGASNNQLQASVDAKNDHIQPTTVTSSSRDQRETAQRVESETRRSESEGGGGEALASAIDSLNSKLDGLTDIKLDSTEITTALSVLGTEIVGALGAELSVSVTNPTFDVNVLSLPAGATTDAAASVGADVTALAANLDNLAGVQDIQKTDIASLTTRVTTGETTDTAQNADISQLKTDTSGLDAATITTQISSEISTAQTTIQGQVDDAIVAVDGKIVANTALIGTVKQTADEAKTTADSLEDSIQTASDTAIEAKNTADDTKTVADATKIVADNAALVAAAAESEASLATAEITKITQTVNANRQGIEAEVRTIKGVVDTNKSVGTDNTKAIRKLAGDVIKADSVAQTANARANQR